MFLPDYTTSRVKAQYSSQSLPEEPQMSQQLTLYVTYEAIFTQLTIFNTGAGTAQSVWRLATGWAVRGTSPGRGKRFLSSLKRSD